MTTKNLSIQIEAVIKGLAQVQQLGQGLKDVTRYGKDMGGGLGAATGGMGGFSAGAAQAASSLTSFMDHANQANQSVLAMTGYLKTAVLAFVAFAGLSAGKDSADLAARNETLGNTLEVIGFNAGYSTEELKKYEAEVRQVGVTTQVARDTITQFIRAGIDIGPAMEGGVSRVQELTRAAQNLARATGQNTSETLQRLVLNIQQLDTVGLRFIGVTVNSEAAFASYAQTIGKAASALSTAEKQQALMNEVVKQGAGIAGVYEKSLQTVGGQVQSMKRYQEEASAQIGRVFLPAYMELVKASTAFLKEVQAIATAVADSGVAAETFRSAMAAAISFGTAVAGSIKSVLQSIAPAVIHLVDRVKDAFSTFDMSGIADSASTVLSAISTVITTLLNVVASSAVEIRGVADAFGILFSSVGKVISSFAALGASESSLSASTSILKGLLTGLGYLIAGLGDGITVFGMLFQQAIGLAGVVIGTLMERIGRVVSVVFPQMGESIKEVGADIVAFGLKSVESANKTFAAFSNGETAVSKYRQAMQDLTVEYTKFDSVSRPSAADQTKAFDTASEAVRKYAEAVRKGTLTSEQATERYAKVKEQVQALADQYKFTDAQIKQLNTSLEQSKVKGEDVSKAYADLKISATELATGMSDAGGRAVKAFQSIATQAIMSGEQISKAFAEALDNETSIKGLTRFKTAIEELFKAGKIDASQYREALGQVNLKFVELAEKGTKAAKTSADFEELNRAIVEVGKSGAVAGAFVSAALDKITEKAKGARAEARRLSEDFKSATGAGAALAEADLKTSKASLDVSKARLAVEKAQQEHQTQRTAESKAALTMAQAELGLKEQLATQTALEGQQTLANEQAIAAQRDLDRAKDAAEREPTNEHAQTLLAAAQEQFEIKQNESNTAAGMVNIQRQQVSQAERQVVLAQQGLDKAKQQRDVEEAKAAAHQAFLGGLIASYQVINNASRTLVDAGYAVRTAQEMGAKVRDMAYQNTGSIREMITQLARGERLLKSMVDHANAQKTKADEVGKSFAKAKDEAQQLEDAVNGIATSQTKSVSMGEIYAKQMREIRREAEALSRAAAESAMSFVKGLGSIKEELLQAQGKEEAAARMRFDSRRNELRLEYDLLRVKLLGAKLTAEAAGIDTSNITRAMSELDSGFNEAISNLNKLEKLESGKRQKERQKERDEEAQRAAEAAKAEQEARLEKATETSDGVAKRDQELFAAMQKKAVTTAPVVIDPLAGSDVMNAVVGTLGMATDVASAAASGATEADKADSRQRPDKIIRVELASGNRSVSATIAERDEAALLSILESARGLA